MQDASRRVFVALVLIVIALLLSVVACSPAQGAYLDFGDVDYFTVLPAVLPDGTVISEIGTKPANVRIEAPQPKPGGLVAIPDCPDSFMCLTQNSDLLFDVVRVNDSDYGFRLDFPGEVNAIMSPWTRHDLMRMSIESDGIWEVVKNVADWEGSGTSLIRNINGLRDEVDLSPRPINNGLELLGATWLEWRAVSYVAHIDNPQVIGLGNIMLSDVPEPASAGVLLLGMVWLVARLKADGLNAFGQFR